MFVAEGRTHFFSIMEGEGLVIRALGQGRYGMLLSGDARDKGSWSTGPASDSSRITAATFNHVALLGVANNFVRHVPCFQIV